MGRAATVRSGRAASARPGRAAVSNSGRVTPARGARPSGAGVRSKLSGMGQGRYDVSQSRSVQTPWVWRGMLMMSMLAVGVALVMLGNGLSTLAALWGVIAVGWFAISMWLWKKHRNAMLE